jgi:hypothetical protein
MAEPQTESKLGFVDALARLFGRKAATPEPPREAAPLEGLQAGFEKALRELNERAAELRRKSAPTATDTVAPPEQTSVERAAARERSIEAARRAMREDIGEMHARLRTGLAETDLEALAAYLHELAALAAAGKDSHELLPRARFAITERLQREAGELAVARLVALLQREKIEWPDPTRYQQTATPEEIERSRRRRLAETRAFFLAQDLARTAERLLGVVEVWGADYPDPGSPLWEETVLEGVAAGIRAQLVKGSVELLRRDRDQLVAQVEGSLGTGIAALQGAVQAGVPSLEEANRAVAGCLGVLDRAVPDLAWEHVRSGLPSARGEWDPGAGPG